MRHNWNDLPDWQKDYFGRHVQLIPAKNARGYQYRPFADQRIIRAMPADGTVSTPSPFNVNAPQVSLRMDDHSSRATKLGRKLRAMLKGRHTGKV